MATLLEPVKSLWIGPSLPPAQAACLKSFVNVGHSVELFTYADLPEVPEGVVLRDAREILPETEIFTYGAAAGVGSGSVSAFSNIFRYKILHDHGGCGSTRICFA